MKELIKELLKQDGYWIVNRKIVSLFGIEAALILAELMSRESFLEGQGKILQGGFFPYGRSDFEAKFGLSDHQQRKAFEKLYEAKVVESKRLQMPRRNVYKIEYPCLSLLMLKICTSEDSKNSRPLNGSSKRKAKITASPCSGAQEGLNGSGTAQEAPPQPASGDSASPATPPAVPPKPYKPKNTPEAQIVYYIKAKRGIKLDDREWDKEFFGWYEGLARKRMLPYLGSVDAAMSCIGDLVNYCTEKALSWSFQKFILSNMDDWKFQKDHYGKYVRPNFREQKDQR